MICLVERLSTPLQRRVSSQWTFYDLRDVLNLGQLGFHVADISREAKEMPPAQRGAIVQPELDLGERAGQAAQVANPPRG